MDLVTEDIRLIIISKLINKEYLLFRQINKQFNNSCDSKLLIKRIFKIKVINIINLSLLIINVFYDIDLFNNRTIKNA